MEQLQKAIDIADDLVVRVITIHKSLSRAIEVVDQRKKRKIEPERSFYGKVKKYLLQDANELTENNSLDKKQLDDYLEYFYYINQKIRDDKELFKKLRESCSSQIPLEGLSNRIINTYSNLKALSRGSNSMYLEQNDVINLENSLTNVFRKINRDLRQSVLQNAGVDNSFISQLHLNLELSSFATELVAKFIDYNISKSQPSYHPMKALLDYFLKQSQKYNLSDEDINIFNKIISIFNNIKDKDKDSNNGSTEAVIELRELEQRLAYLYDREYSKIADYAGIRKELIAIKAKPTDQWHEVVSEAIKEKKLGNIVKAALNDYKDDEILNEVDSQLNLYLMDN